MTFKFKNPTTGQVQMWEGIELVERHMNEMAKTFTEPTDKLYAQLQALTQIVGNLVDDLNPHRSNVLKIVEAYDLEETKEALTDYY